MLLFLCAVGLLICGYFVYSKFVEKIWGINTEKKTPAIRYADGIDYVTMPLWKVFMIQFLNIAGLGPVFGAILGAVYGPVVLLWIVFGCIFAGGVHDYLSGMISVRYKGKTIIYLIEKLFGKYFKIIFLFFFLSLLLLLGTVFAINPAKMLSDLFHTPLMLWLVIIFGYYFLATLLPIDKIIGKFYPFFAALLVVMTFLVMFALIKTGNSFYPDLTFHSLHPSNTPIFPLLFVTVACGAISGFHATQSPIMARCLSNEKDGRLIFYGAMITEGIIALIWATLGIAFYKHSGNLLNAIMTIGEGGVISQISTSLLGKIGGILTVLSVIILSVTSGDTAFRSIRITIADFIGCSQKKVINRIVLSIFIFSFSLLLSRFNYITLWQYFGWANQMLACFVLWTASYYLVKKRKFYWIALIPALFMTSVCISYIAQEKIGFNLTPNIANYVGIIFAIIILFLFYLCSIKYSKQVKN